MKKLLILTFALLVSLSVFGRPRELNPKVIDDAISDWVLEGLRELGYAILPEVIVQDTLNRSKMSNYEKYWESKNGKLRGGPKPEYDDLYFNPKTDQPRVKHSKRNDVDRIIDTLVQENPNIEVNYYYNSDPFYYSHNIGRFYHGGFNYWMYSNMWSYNNYWMMDQNDWYWESRFMGYPFWPYSSFYFADRYDYWGWNRWNYNPWRFNHNHYTQWNNYNSYGYNRSDNFRNNINYGRGVRPSTMTSQRRVDPKPLYNQPNRSRNAVSQARPVYSESRRSYTPAYEKPRLSTRPSYNNTRINNNPQYRENSNNSQVRRSEVRTPETRTQTRTYSTPSTNRSYSSPSTTNRSYSQPSNSYNSTNRSSNYSQPSNNYNSSGRSSVSSGSNGSFNSGGGSGRSSGGSSSSSSSGRR